MVEPLGRARVVFSLEGIFFLLLGGCSSVPEPPRYQDTSPPGMSLHEKAALYQNKLELRFQTPEGLLQYARVVGQTRSDSYGALADGCFHTGIYLGSQALRHATTGSPASRDEILKTLNGLDLLMEVTGRRGLLARHFSPVGTVDRTNCPVSITHPAYVFRRDVSRDQYAGFIFGLGVVLALVDDPEIRARVAKLATAAADHLLANELKIIGPDGRQTKHGDMRGWILGIPRGPNAAIALAIAKVAAESGGEEVHRDFYRRLVEKGYASLVRWNQPPLLDSRKRVNENMVYLALYTLFLLERDPAILAELRAGEEKIWNRVRGERNAFFSFVHASGGCQDAFAGKTTEFEGCPQGRLALLEFPESKVEWPVNLTRAGFDFPRAFSLRSTPVTTSGVPLYLRPRGSSFWVSNPYRLVARMSSRGERETAGVDYLQAYWMGRYHGYLGPRE